MRHLLAAAFVSLLAAPLFAADPLPSRSLEMPLLVGDVQDVQPINFDLFDFRVEQQHPPLPNPEIDRRTIFTIKQHLGFAAGYDNGVLHSAIGFYVTVAEWGRWNFGIPAPELGFGRYTVYDAGHKRWLTKHESSIFISLASVHYRVGYLRSAGVNCYINFEQIFDTRQNMTGSQIGVSFSRK